MRVRPTHNSPLPKDEAGPGGRPDDPPRRTEPLGTHDVTINCYCRNYCSYSNHYGAALGADRRASSRRRIRPTAPSKGTDSVIARIIRTRR